MIFTTTDNREVNVGIAHQWTEISRYPGQKVRVTYMWLHSILPDGQVIDIESSAVCSPYDQFSRRRGRQLVREVFLPQFEEPRLLATGVRVYEELPPIKYCFSKEDRKRIYKVLLPEFHTDRFAQTKKILKKIRELVFPLPTVNKQTVKQEELEYNEENLTHEQWQEKINSYLQEPVC